MIKFKKKEFTIPEGYYTGPKDLTKIPGTLELIGKGSTIGAITGGIAGKFMEDSNIIDGAITGSKVGTLSGIAAKLLLNYIHKPMTKIKYQEVDRNIRRQFGVYQISGFTVGDNTTNRGNIRDKFSYNDRNVCDYKINFAIYDNKVTMYTFGMTRDELDGVSKILDEYCKKYYAMKYSAKLINQRVYSYAVDIIFTNYQVINNFIIELSDFIKSKINLLDNNAIINTRLSESAENFDVEERTYSVSSINKYELIKILTKGVTTSITFANRLKDGISTAILGAIIEGIQYLGKNEINKVAGVSGQKLSELNNSFLENELKKLHFVDGFSYTTGNEATKLNMSLTSGIFILTAVKELEKELDKKVWKSFPGKVNKSKINGVGVYTYAVKSLSEFELLLNKVMSVECDTKPNIFDNPVFKKRKKLFSSNMIEKLVDKLEKDRLEDFEVSNRIPKDVISITTDLKDIRIYIPTELDYAQYEIDDEIRRNAKFLRTKIILDRNIYEMTLIGGTLTFSQYYNVVKYIIKEQGFCTLLDL